MKPLIVMVPVLLFFIMSTVSARSNETVEGRLISHLLDTGYDVRIMPLPDEITPVTVVVDFYLSLVIDMDEKRQTFTAASYISASWMDARLSWKPADYNHVTETVLTADSIWTPSCQMQNTVTSSDKDIFGKAETDKCHVRSSGVVSMGVAFSHSTFCPTTFKDFPFDRHVCQLCIRSPNTPATKLQWDVNILKQTPIEPHPEWDTTQLTLSNESRTYPVVCINFEIQRLAYFYVRNIMRPMLMINILGTASFLIPLKSGERVGACISLVLGFTVFQIVLADLLPRTSRPAQEPRIVDYAVATFSVLTVIAACSILTTSLSSCRWKIRNKVARAFFFGCLGRLTLVKPLLTKQAQVMSVQTDGESTDKHVEGDRVHSRDAASDMEDLAAILDRLILLSCLAFQITTYVQVKLSIETT